MGWQKSQWTKQINRQIVFDNKNKLYFIRIIRSNAAEKKI